MSSSSFFESTLGIRFPLIQAPMAGAQDAQMAIAVSEAGGLGSLPSAAFSVAELEGQLQQLSEGTSKPYNVNFFCHQEPVRDEAKERAWLAALAPDFQQLGLHVDDIELTAARQPFNAAVAETVAAFKPPVVSFHFGLPDAKLLEYVKSWGALVLSSATTVEEGLWLQAHGADAVIAQGLEAGGHRGHFLSDDLSLQSGTFALVPQLAAQLDIPVIAAGGVTGRHAVRAALALGAAGVQAGTAYLLAHESLISPLHRHALQGGKVKPTALTSAFTGRPARGITNAFLRAQIGRTDTPAFPLPASVTKALRQAAEAQGSADFTPLWSGQSNYNLLQQSAADITVYLAVGIED